MPKRRVNLIELQRLKDAGKTQTDVCKEKGWSPAAVSKNWRALTVATMQDVVLRAAEQVNRKKMDALGQLTRINEGILRELSEIEKKLAKSDYPERLEIQGAQRNHAGEVRKQLKLLLEISETLYDVEQVKNFQEIVLEELGAIDEELRKRVLARLRERRATGSLFGISGS